MSTQLAESRFAELRPTLLAVAYHVTGTRADAEDAVQEAWLRWAQVDQAAVQDPRGYLAVLVSRVALNQRRAAARRREDYPGPWLPEPIADDGSPEWQLLHREQLGLALDLALSRLTPEQATVFVLHRLVGLDHATVARALGTTPASSRQLLARAVRQVGDPQTADHQSAEPPADSPYSAVVDDLVDALLSGDVGRVTELISPDITLIGDGGGKVTATMRPVVGADKVVRFLAGVLTKAAPDLQLLRTVVNGQPALVSVERGQVTSVVCCTVQQTGDGPRIAAVQLVRNPDKLIATNQAWGQGRLGQVGTGRGQAMGSGAQG